MSKKGLQRGFKRDTLMEHKKSPKHTDWLMIE
jgi:hypothetical protein